MEKLKEYIQNNTEGRLEFFNSIYLDEPVRAALEENLDNNNILELIEDLEEFIKINKPLWINDNFSYEDLKEVPSDKINQIPEHLMHLVIEIIINNDSPLPEGIKNIKVEESYNKPLQKLPESLLKLDLGVKFNHSINVLPKNLQELILSDCYKKPLPELPKNLLKLDLKNNYTHFISKFPKKLEELNLGGYNKIIKSLNNLKVLNLGKYDKPLPYTRSFIKKYYNDNKEEMTIIEKYFQILPNTLRKLIIGNNKRYIYRFPDKLEELVIDCDYSFELPELPNSLLKLYFKGLYSKIITRFPDNLVLLVLSYDYNHPLPKLPNNLLILVLGHSFNHPLPELPSTLQVLVLGRCFNQSLPVLPESLQELYLDKSFNQPIPLLPKSLKIINNNSIYDEESEDENI